ncbi:MAG: hypothetical protein D8M26_11215 [Ignavibacteriae bacterium]|nr:MAG: hypothetical protein EDM72_12975 [Chlorobiota bacterium]MBL1123449.1 hypothetical protein [Ignavibacteriota bacterium]MCE7856606.1 hypothetical protein [Ignavibacteria bacterium CHB3]
MVGGSNPPVPTKTKSYQNILTKFINNIFFIISFEWDSGGRGFFRRNAFGKIPPFRLKIAQLKVEFFFFKINSGNNKHFSMSVLLSSN